VVTNQEYDFPSPTEEKIFLFYYQKKVREVRIKSEFISEDRNVYPYKVGWKYLSMEAEGLEEDDIRQIKSILCDALQIYGQFGCRIERNKNLKIICIDFEGDE